MAAIQGYADLLRKYGHTVRIFMMDGMEMKEQRYKAAVRIFMQCKKSKKNAEDAIFDKDNIDVSDISDAGRYYGGILFVPSVASRYCLSGRSTAGADAAHCDGVGPQLYGSTLEVVTYDTNVHL
ncbi:hypothetical protein BWQ96_10412 [Gracilariopsis chorda]|uniref:Uncharacterized protein n=1 Tax=Gracilariopsis chorda TaxID=448386 RepID=A0A2V3ICU0_9FLOR|nr:hypothetical protein BWQ96_10412 [Gracilariopsis chorda]|eukprot:PXF39881.1 hypothetical protein BWQ96_10412 [Gracilariopsis chorda]